MRLRPRLKTVRRLLITLAVVGGATAGGAALLDRVRPEEEPVAAPVAVFDVAEATAASSSRTETLSGTVESSGSVQIVHRLDDGDDSTSGAATATTTPAAELPTGQAGESRALDVVDPSEPAGATEAAVATTTTTSTTTTTVPVTTATPTTPATTTATTSTTTPTPATIAPTTTMPVETTTTVAAPTTTERTTSPSTSSTTSPTTEATVPEQSGAGGGRATGGGSTGAAPGGAAAAATGSASQTTSGAATEKVTSLPAVGESVEVGDVLYTVDGQPVVVMSGELPAWRTMSTDSDDGVDIEQLEESLSSLGYGTDLTVDTTFDSATAAAVEAWQEGLGMEATGEVELGSVVFLAESATVTEVASGVGSDVSDGTAIATVTTPDQQVAVSLAADELMLLQPGDSVELAAADSVTVTGTVTNVQSVTADDGTMTVDATITPAGDLGVPSGSSVDVAVTLDDWQVIDAGAVLVPAEAVVSRLDGTYAVKVRDDAGNDVWVPVELVEVQGLNVAITSEAIAEGTQVLVPA